MQRHQPWRILGSRRLQWASRSARWVWPEARAGPCVSRFDFPKFVGRGGLEFSYCCHQPGCLQRYFGTLAKVKRQSKHFVFIFVLLENRFSSGYSCNYFFQVFMILFRSKLVSAVLECSEVDTFCSGESSWGGILQACPVVLEAAQGLLTSCFWKSVHQVFGVYSEMQSEHGAGKGGLQRLEFGFQGKTASLWQFHDSFMKLGVRSWRHLCLHWQSARSNFRKRTFI